MPAQSNSNPDAGGTLPLDCTEQKGAHAMEDHQIWYSHLEESMQKRPSVVTQSDGVAGHPRALKSVGLNAA